MILELKQQDKTKKHTGKIRPGSVLQEVVNSGMAKMLDNLRETLAQSHGEVFPHAILSSLQIAQLCVQKPVSLAQVEGVLGKRKSEQYGKEVLDAIENYIGKNSDSPAVTAQWVSPKNSHPLVLPESAKVSKQQKLEKNNLSANKKRKLDTVNECICIQDSGSEKDEFRLS